jgi:hypothetical protein
VKTPSESTLPELLISLNFNSRISNTYKKPQGEGPSPPPKFVNSSLPARLSCVHAGIRATPIPSIAYSRFSAHPGWGASSRFLCATSAPSASLRYLFPSCLSTSPHSVIPSEAEGSAFSSPPSSLRHLRALCVSALSFSFLPFDFPTLSSRAKPRELLLQFLISLPRYFITSQSHGSRHLYRRRNTAKMNYSSRPNGHTV